MSVERYAPVGAVVRSGYWGTTYRVLAHVTHDDWRGESVRVETLDGPQAGRVHEHGTPFDPQRDRILWADTGAVHGPERCAHRLGEGERVCRDCFASVGTRCTRCGSERHPMADLGELCCGHGRPDSFVGQRVAGTPRTV